MWVFLLAGLIAVERYREQPTTSRLALVTVLTMVGVCFREIVLIIACILPFTVNPFRAGELRVRWREVLPRFVALPAGVLMMAALRLVAKKTNDYDFLWTAGHWLYDKPWPMYLLSWFLAFGPMLWLAIFHARKGAAFLAAHQHLVIFLAAFTVLGDIGGTDTERFLYWSMPVVYVLIGRALEERPWPGWLLAVLVGAQLIASRAVFWPIPYLPDAAHLRPVFTPFGRDVPWDDLYTWTEGRPLASAQLVEYFAFGAALGGWLFWRRRTTLRAEDARIQGEPG